MNGLTPSQEVRPTTTEPTLKGIPMSTSSVAVGTPSTIALLEQVQERRRAAAEMRVRAFLERQREARRQLVIRADVARDDLVTTYRTLYKLGYIKLDDLMVAPGFNLLDDGEVGSVNSETPEWQFWAELNSLAESAKHLAGALIAAGDDLKLAGHWNAEVSA